MASPCGSQVQTPDQQPDHTSQSTVSVAALVCSPHVLPSGTSGNTQQHMHIMTQRPCCMPEFACMGGDDTAQIYFMRQVLALLDANPAVER